MMHPIYRYRDDDYHLSDSRRPEGQGASSAPQTIERRRSRRQPQNTGNAPYLEERPRSAYYTPLDNEESVIPRNPYAPIPKEQEIQQPADAERSSFFSEDGSEFEAPAMPQLPEWYRIAQQNASPVDERRRNAPMVRTATVFEPEEQEIKRDALGRPLRHSPVQAADVPSSREAFYEKAGYPKELIMEQQRISEEEAMINNRRRHGAMRATHERPDEAAQPAAGMPRRRPLTEQERMRRAEAVERYQRRQETEDWRQPRSPQQEEYGRQAYRPAREKNPYRQMPVRDDYAPRRRDTEYDREQRYETHASYETYEEYDEEAAPLLKRIRSWIVVGVFAFALIASVLFALEVHYADETKRLLEDRARAQELFVEQHPMQYQEWIEREAAKNNLNPAFVSAIIFNESTFRPHVESNVGARGLMQVMEPTAKDIAEELGIENFTFDMLYDPETNIIFGCYYLGQLSQRFRGDPVCVSAAYHAGAQQVQNWLNSSKYSNDGQTLLLSNMNDGPTKQYATRVQRDFAIYQRMYFSHQEGK